MLLLLLSLATAVSAAQMANVAAKHGVLLLLAFFKIILVATFFMDLRLAHRFWIIGLAVLLLLSSAAILIAG